jgi:hypothetical protein
MIFSSKKTFFLIFAASLFIGCKTAESGRPACCLIIPPPITLTGEKTAVETQIIGDYKELEKDAWIVSSVNTNIQKGQEKAGAAGGDILLLKAMKIREFHESKIRKYKDDGAIGETVNGLIVYKSTLKYDEDKESKQILTTVTEEENKARQTIFERTLLKSGIEKPGENEINAFGKIFAEEQRALAKKNDWIQENSGNWVKKK